MKVAVIYWSATGNTQTMAEAIAEGVNEKGGQAELFYVSDFEGDIKEYDMVALGCPAMGAEELEEYEFRPFFDAEKEKLKETNVVLFGSYDWGDGTWMSDWVDRMKAAGATVVGDEGVICNLEPDAEGLDKCKELGKKLAQA